MTQNKISKSQDFWLRYWKSACSLPYSGLELEGMLVKTCVFIIFNTWEGPKELLPHNKDSDLDTFFLVQPWILTVL